MRPSLPLRRGLLAALSAVLVGSLPAACADSELPPLPEPPPSGVPGPAVGPRTAPSEPPAPAGWQRVDIPGSVRGIVGLDSADPPPHLYAAGVEAGEPTLLDVTDGVASWFGGDLPDRYGEGLAAVTTNGEAVTVVEQADPVERRPARLWIGDAFLGGGGTSHRVPRDSHGQKPVWLSPLMDGEGALRAVGAVPADAGRWRLHAWEAWRRWVRLDTHHQLYVQGEPSAQKVLTGTTETTVVVAGAVSDRPGAAGRRPEVWSIVDVPEYSQGRWRRHRTAPTPDGVTDVAYWDIGWWIAGHRDLRPVVYDFNSRPGATLRVPDTRLDPEHPAVYVAGIPVATPIVLATQSVDGPTLWVEERPRSWRRIPAPEGRLSAAKTVGDGIYLVIDERLWFRELRLSRR